MVAYMCLGTNRCWMPDLGCHRGVSLHCAFQQPSEKICVLWGFDAVHYGSDVMMSVENEVSNK